MVPLVPWMAEYSKHRLYPSSPAASRILSLVFCETEKVVSFFKTLDTDAADTPALCATSRIVAISPPLIYLTPVLFS